jgi:hypothetical protein
MRWTTMILEHLRPVENPKTYYDGILQPAKTKGPNTEGDVQKYLEGLRGRFAQGRRAQDSKLRPFRADQPPGEAASASRAFILG